MSKYAITFIAVMIFHGLLAMIPLGVRKLKYGQERASVLNIKIKTTKSQKQNQVVQSNESDFSTDEKKTASQDNTDSKENANSTTPEIPKGDLTAYKRSMLRSIYRERKKHEFEDDGKVVVALTIKKNGMVIGQPSIIRSSGDFALDKKVIRLVVAAGPYSALPQSWGKDHMIVKVPVRITSF